MKHIKKRFLLESDSDKLNFNDPSFEVIDIEPNLPNQILSDKKNCVAFVQTETGNIYGGFVHKVDDKNFLIKLISLNLLVNLR